MSEVIVVIGPGLIGQAIARRVGVGKHIVLADLHEASANAAAETLGSLQRKNPHVCGGSPSGARGTRTPDLLGAIQALSQLSYSPGQGAKCSRAFGSRALR